MYSKLIVFLLLKFLGLSYQQNCQLKWSENIPADIENHCYNISIVVSDNVNLNSTKSFSNIRELIFVGQYNSIKCHNFSGIIISNVSEVEIKNLIFHGCGTLQYANNITYYSAVSMVNCSRINITETTFQNSVGTGLVMVNSRESINLYDSFFQTSRLPEFLQNSSIGGGGVYIQQLNKDQPDYRLNHTVKIILQNCNFSHNMATTSDRSIGCNAGLYSGLGYGGGLSFQFQGSQQTEVEIRSSVFIGNSAIWGGAIEMVLCSAQRHHICFSQITFFGNKASQVGGGIEIFLQGANNKNNIIIMEKSMFRRNSAKYGGATSVSIKKTFENFTDNCIYFNECKWESNKAHFGSAMNIYPARESDGWGTSPKVEISNCSFERNCNCDLPLSSNTILKKEGYGTILITHFLVSFKEKNTFLSNTGSCIHATSSSVVFLDKAATVFENNKAEYGAGIALLGVSVMLIYADCVFVFVNNTVQGLGAGILYHSISKRISAHHNYRFIQPINSYYTKASFHFVENCAPKDTRYLNNIFQESSIQSYSRKNYSHSHQITINSSAKCNIEDYTAIHNEICNYTDDVENSIFTYNYIEKLMYFIPGFERNLSITDPPTLFQVSLHKSGPKRITFSKNNEYVLDSLAFQGEKNATAKIYLKTLSFDGLSVDLDVQLTDCPPLHFFDNNTMTCTCMRTYDFLLMFSFNCFNSDNSYSQISNGFWIDYVPDDTTSGKYLTGLCPIGYCQLSGINDTFMIQLPFALSASVQTLDKAICYNRKGILCGECLPDKVVHYHSRTFECKDKKNCNIGPLIFLLSEILPVTILFLLFIFLDINLASGIAGGFVFFAQVYVSLENRSYIFIKNDIPSIITASHHIFYQLFNFDFLETDLLTFCLRDNATTLKLLAIKYIVSAYALFLIVSVISLVRICSRFKFFKLRLGRHSLMKVISTFLVIVYTKCTSTSFSILWYQSLYNGKKPWRTVVTLQGNLKYFEKEHLPYAITAILTTVFLTLLLPAVLLIYPLSNRVISVLHLHENSVVSFVSKLFPFYKLLPFFDSFQGTFKEKYRFFAGLFFVYRVIILSSLFALRMTVIYLVVLILIMMILTIHVICSPYKSKLHNTVNTLLLINIGLICSFKLLLVYLSKFYTDEAMKFVHAVEIILVNIPIIVGCIVIIKRILMKCKKWKKNKREERNRRDSFLLDDIRNESYSDHYHIM